MHGGALAEELYGEEGHRGEMSHKCQVYKLDAEAQCWKG